MAIEVRSVAIVIAGGFWLYNSTTYGEIICLRLWVQVCPVYLRFVIANILSDQ